MTAPSFARIHRQNLIAQGVRLRVFADVANYRRKQQGDSSSIVGVREAIMPGATKLTSQIIAGATILFELHLPPRERVILRFDRMLAYLRSVDRNPMGIVWETADRLSRWSRVRASTIIGSGAAKEVRIDAPYRPEYAGESCTAAGSPSGCRQ